MYVIAFYGPSTPVHSDIKFRGLVSSDYMLTTDIDEAQTFTTYTDAAVYQASQEMFESHHMWHHPMLIEEAMIRLIYET